VTLEQRLEEYRECLFIEGWDVPDNMTDKILEILVKHFEGVQLELPVQ